MKRKTSTQQHHNDKEDLEEDGKAQEKTANERCMSQLQGT
jgi:hypothetical protein